MKCICGYIQPETVVTQKEVYYQSGKRKGELKGLSEVTEDRMSKIDRDIRQLRKELEEELENYETKNQ